ncbi:MAG: NADH-quinone oxidoreductase subunit NuoG [Alphaproteobacteria bacterium]
MTKLIVDGIEVEVDADLTLIQALEDVGAEIPRFCYHERLSIAGNCRMCLVEVVGAPKPVASCAMGVGDLRPGRNGELPEINTKSALVKKAREGVMEFLLINHPLDCPICDQGGECDLQDQAMAFGGDASRFFENKRAVEEKDIGPLVKTTMTRCIHCTRCVRFLSEIAGVEELGAIGRGEDMEITTYLEEAMTSELQGNVIDLCPVGALTSKPYAFTARSWELRKTETIDVMDAVGSNIRVDARGREVMRILPINNDAVNEEWISDKTRFIWDGLKAQRLDQPYLRVGGQLKPASWAQAFSAIAERVKASKPGRMAALAGDLCAAEDMFALKLLLQSLGVTNMDCRQDGSPLGEVGGRAGYLFNATIAGIEEADAILLVGTNPRFEAAVLNARIRKNWLTGAVKIGLIGQAADLTYDFDYLGAGPASLKALEQGQGDFAKILKKAKRPMIIVGAGAVARPDGAAVLGLAAALAVQVGAVGDKWNGFCVLHNAAGRVGGLDLGFLPGAKGRGTKAILDGARDGQIEILYLLGADEFDVSELGDAFVIYQGSHGDRAAHRADVILPSAAFTEKSATYVNTEGRPQRARRAVFPPGQAREDWAIVRALSGQLGAALAFDSLDQLRALMVKAHPHLGDIDQITPADPKGVEDLARLAGKQEPGTDPFVGAVEDFYTTNPIARTSRVMIELSAMNVRRRDMTGTHS